MKNSQKYLVLTLTVALALSACTNPFSKSEPVPTTDKPLKATDTTDVSASTLFPDNIEVACSGVAVSKAKAYTKDKGIHSLYVFDRNSATDKYIQKTGAVPEQWEKPWEHAAETELAACVTVASSTPTKMCDYTIEGDKYQLQLHDAKFDAKLVEANTGKDVATKSFDLKSGECPSIKFFSKKLENEYPDYSQSLLEFVKPYVQIQ